MESGAKATLDTRRRAAPNSGTGHRRMKNDAARIRADRESAERKTNIPAFIKFVREHQRPSFLEYGEYPYVSSDEIQKALRLKKAFSEMLDQMQ